MKLTPDWICGFVEGLPQLETQENFVIYIAICKQTTQVTLIFKVTQHIKNVQVLYALKSFFGVGIVKPQTRDREKVWEYVVRRFEHLNTKIIPFFEKNQMHTTKKFDFLRFRKAAILISRKEHLTSEGLVKIKAIASRMNKLVSYSETDGNDLVCDYMQELSAN